MFSLQHQNLPPRNFNRTTLRIAHMVCYIMEHARMFLQAHSPHTPQVLDKMLHFYVLLSSFPGSPALHPFPPPLRVIVHSAESSNVSSAAFRIKCRHKVQSLAHLFRMPSFDPQTSRFKHEQVRLPHIICVFQMRHYKPLASFTWCLCQGK